LQKRIGTPDQKHVCTYSRGLLLYYSRRYI